MLVATFLKMAHVTIVSVRPAWYDLLKNLRCRGWGTRGCCVMLATLNQIYFKYWTKCSANKSPSIAQLVERRTVADEIDILRSLVRIRLEGLFWLEFCHYLECFITVAFTLLVHDFFYDHISICVNWIVSTNQATCNFQSRK